MKKAHNTHRTSALIYGLVFACLLFAYSSNAYAVEGRWAWTESAGWTHTEGSIKGTAPEQFAYASELEKKGEFYDAARQYFLLVQSFPNSPEASLAFTRLAKCLFDCENYYHSFRVVEEYIKKYPKSRHLDELLAFEYRIGRRFLEGALVTLFDEKNTRRKSLRAAEEVFSGILSHEAYIYRGEFADDALYQLGMTYMELNDYKMAKDQFVILESRFRGTSELVPLARYRRKLCDIQLGHGTTEQAMEELNRLQRIRKASGQGAEDEESVDTQLQQSVDTLKSKEAAKMLKSAEFYERRNSPKSYGAAVFSYQEIIRRYPDAPQAATAKERLAKLKEHGQPDPDIGERKFSLPIPKINLPKPRLNFWSKPESEEEEPEYAVVVGDEEYQKLDISPIKSRLYSAGDVVIDVDAEEAKLRNIDSGATPEALAPQAEEEIEEYIPPVPRVAYETEIKATASEPLGKETASLADPVDESRAEEVIVVAEDPEETILVLPEPRVAAEPITVAESKNPTEPEQVAQAKPQPETGTQDGWVWSEEFNED